MELSKLELISQNQELLSLSSELQEAEAKANENSKKNHRTRTEHESLLEKYEGFQLELDDIKYNNENLSIEKKKCGFHST